MLSCEEVCNLVSASQDDKLSWRKRFRVKIHLIMCKACQRMSRQMKLLRAAARNYQSTNDEELLLYQEKLSEEASARIRGQLRHAQSRPAKK